MEKQIEHIGKKIFLLYPHSVIRDEMLDLLIMAGFETYTLTDERRAWKLLEKFKSSIMFINIDEGLNENEWEAYIKALLTSPKTAGSRLGIMSYNLDYELMRKYLMELAIPCGYVQLKLGLKESTKIILSVLEANEARGRRKSIRANCEDDISATINYKQDSVFFHGKILDISSGGIAARFDKMGDFPLNFPLENVQLKLYGGIVMAKMLFIGQRRDDRRVQIMLFDPNMAQDSKLIIHRYIKQRLQKYINGLKL